MRYNFFMADNVTIFCWIIFSSDRSNFPFSLVNQLIRLSYLQKFYAKVDDKKYFEGLAFWSGLQLWSTIYQIQFSFCKMLVFADAKRQ